MNTKLRNLRAKMGQLGHSSEKVFHRKLLGAKSFILSHISYLKFGYNHSFISRAIWTALSFFLIPLISKGTFYWNTRSRNPFIISLYTLTLSKLISFCKSSTWELTNSCLTSYLSLSTLTYSINKGLIIYFAYLLTSIILLIILLFLITTLTFIIN